MRLTASKETLMLALGRIQGIVGKKSTMPILSNVLIESTATDRFTMVATDLDIFSKGEYDGLIDDPGRICVNGRDLHDIVRNLPAGTIQLETADDHNVKIIAGKVKFKVPTTSVDDYPNMPDFGEVDYAQIDPAILLDLIEHTLFSVANDDPRIFLNGVNLEPLEEGKLRLVSTDGHRLSLVDREISSDVKVSDPVIIPRKGLIELRKLLEENAEPLEMAFSASNGFFKRDDALLVMRLIEGEFPDYNMVVPKGADRRVTLNRVSFTDALKRISILSADRSHGVRFKISSGEFVIEASSPERGEGREELEAVYEGELMQVGFNARYFLEAINVIHGDEVVLELADELSPCVVKDGSDDGFLSVIMPMRIS